MKTRKDTFASAEGARQAAQSEMQRVDRGAATLSLALALGRPHLTPQAAVTVEGFQPEIDGEGWLVRSVEIWFSGELNLMTGKRLTQLDKVLWSFEFGRTMEHIGPSMLQNSKMPYTYYTSLKRRPKQYRNPI